MLRPFLLPSLGSKPFFLNHLTKNLATLSLEWGLYPLERSYVANSRSE